MLSGVPLFAHLAAARLARLEAAGGAVELPAHHIVYRTGEPIRVAYILLRGTLKRTTRLAGEAEKVIELVQSPQLVALGELFGPGQYVSSGETLSPCLLFSLDIDLLRGVVRDDPELSWGIIRAIAERQCAVEFDASGYHYGLTGTQRLLEYLVGLAGRPSSLAGETTVTLTASKRTIASRIDMTPETFSRSLRMLSDSGVIVVDGRSIHIQNAALLNPRVGAETQLVTFPRKTRSAGGRAGKKLSAGVLINLCGRHRVLSQRLAMAWAMIVRDIGSRKARVKLRQLEAEFARNLARMNSADLPASLGERLAAVTEIWPRYRQALFAAEPVAAGAHGLLDLSEEILAAADRMTRHAADLAGTPEAHYVNISGRNRMLSQRICKLFLFRELAAADSREIMTSCQEFESNLSELWRCGKRGPELDAQLQEVAEQWREFQKVLMPALADIAPSSQSVSVLAAGERLLRHVDTTVKLYERITD